MFIQSDVYVIIVTPLWYGCSSCSLTLGNHETKTFSRLHARGRKYIRSAWGRQNSHRNQTEMRKKKKREKYPSCLRSNTTHTQSPKSLPFSWPSCTRAFFFSLLFHLRFFVTWDEPGDVWRSGGSAFEFNCKNRLNPTAGLDGRRTTPTPDVTLWGEPGRSPALSGSGFWLDARWRLCFFHKQRRVAFYTQRSPSKSERGKKGGRG